MTDPAARLSTGVRAECRGSTTSCGPSSATTTARATLYAAGITYFTIFAMFPILMVGFAAGGFVLAGRARASNGIENRIKAVINGDLGQQIVQLMDSAIASRTSVGIIGLSHRAWAGLGWMNNPREAL